ncbi:MAG: DUF2808 domain-containing protein [Gemmatimonadaceae bacterium]|nr:DUF2808 domain-containing protein [Gloeobacterales cyanobacterium ES-bin-141]
MRMLILGIALVLLSGTPVPAGQLQSGETFFERFPALTRAATSNYSTSYNFARYIFEVNVPTDSGEPLGGLVIGIPDGPVRVPSPDMIRAVSSDGAALDFAQVSLEGRNLRLVFARPVSPGAKVTIEFYPMRNPRIGGTYLFEVSAFPSGSAPRTQFLSFGRVTFYEPGGRR